MDCNCVLPATKSILYVESIQLQTPLNNHRMRMPTMDFRVESGQGIAKTLITVDVSSPRDTINNDTCLGSMI